eukprot:3313591-Pleurochrysis_carterae.AAC.2
MDTHRQQGFSACMCARVRVSLQIQVRECVCLNYARARGGEKLKFMNREGDWLVMVAAEGRETRVRLGLRLRAKVR